MRVLIVGAGGHGRVVADILLCEREAGGCVEPIGFVDDAPGLAGARFFGLPVHGPVVSSSRIVHDAVIVAVGDNGVRAGLYERLRRAGERFVTARHPSALLARDVVLGSGVMVCAGVVVNCGTVIGANVILNTGATIDHDCTVADHVHIAPGTHLGGNVAVGDGAFLGIGSAVIPGRSIGAWSTVGAGALVHRDVTPGLTVVGVPAMARRATPGQEQDDKA